jgi:hypothetical protein
VVGPKYGVSGAEVGAEGCRDPAILFSSRMTLTIRLIMFPVANSTNQLITPSQKSEDIPLGLASMSLLPIALMILINSSTVEYLTCRTIFLMRVAVAIAALRDPTI